MRHVQSFTAHDRKGIICPYSAKFGKCGELTAFLRIPDGLPSLNNYNWLTFYQLARNSIILLFYCANLVFLRRPLATFAPGFT